LSRGKIIFYKAYTESEVKRCYETNQLPQGGGIKHITDVIRKAMGPCCVDDKKQEPLVD